MFQKSDKPVVYAKERKVMSSAETATSYVRRMVERETRGNGDTESAVRRLSQMLGLDYWPLEHLRRGKAKSVEAGFFARLRQGYIAYCERQVANLQNEIAIEKALTDDVDLENLEREIEALASQIQAKKAQRLAAKAGDV